MNREEFLRQLREALEGKVPDSVIVENTDYYRTYINSQVAAGRSETEVLRELGAPGLLAKTIEESSKFATGRAQKQNDRYGRYSEGYGGSYGQNQRESYADDMQRPDERMTAVPGWLVAVIAIVEGILIISVVFSILMSLLPVIIAVLAAVLVYRLIKSLFR